MKRMKPMKKPKKPAEIPIAESYLTEAVLVDCPHCGVTDIAPPRDCVIACVSCEKGLVIQSWSDEQRKLRRQAQ